MKKFLPFLLALLLVACEMPATDTDVELDTDSDTSIDESMDDDSDVDSDVEEDDEDDEDDDSDVDSDVQEGDGDEDEDEDEEDDEDEDSNDDVQAGAVQQFNITGDEFSYSPSTITAKAGAPIEINFSNHGDYRHDLVIEGTDGRTSLIESDFSDTFQVTLAAGTYKFYCSVSGHEAQGMKGTLIVQ
ncbi:MAG: cupredoxin domain-containing protein [Patescibacteria group bacterium]